MRLASLILVILVSGTHGFCAPPPPSPLPRSSQTSDETRQILVQGGTFPQRSAVLTLARELRETALKALNLSPAHYPVARPLLFLLREDLQPNSLPLYGVIEDPGGLKIQIELAPFVEEPRLGVERTIVALFLIELGLREHASIPGGGPKGLLSPPRWLVDVLTYKHHNPDPLLSPPQLRQLLDAGKVPSLALLLSRPESDWVASTQEEVDLARALFWMLNNRPDGREGLQRMLHTDFSVEPLRALSRCFPSLGNAEMALQKEWTLAVAAFGTQAEILSLNGPQTEQQIQNLLQLELAETNTSRRFTTTLEHFEDYMRLDGIGGILSARQLEWIALRGRAHFMYAEVISAYAQICGALAQGNTKGVKRSLQAATLERESIAARLDRIHDHLNWFEAVQAPRINSSRIREFYHLLNTPHAVSPAVKQALDRAEERLKAEVEEEDIRRILDEAGRRKQNSP